MISRRNIRIKVMQTLYSVGEAENAESGIAQSSRILDDKLEQSLDIFTFSLLFITRVAQYAESDAQTRANRYLKTSDDIDISTKIATNSFVLKITNNKSFNERVAKSHLDRFVSDEKTKKVFNTLLKSEEYNTYIHEANSDKLSDTRIMQFIWEKLILGDEETLSYCSDELPGWEDDADLIVMLMQNFFRSKEKIDFYALLDKSKRLYAHELLSTVIEKKDLCVERIGGKLNNWDKDRVAIIDILLIRMGICEFLFFPTIPTKVTINEYIDIAKQYSTPQSGQFVNGVLDNILKDLVKEDLIHKNEKSRN